MVWQGSSPARRSRRVSASFMAEDANVVIRLKKPRWFEEARGFSLSTGR